METIKALPAVALVDLARQGPQGNMENVVGQTAVTLGHATDVASGRGAPV
jgi:hypothetical protein